MSGLSGSVSSRTLSDPARSWVSYTLWSLGREDQPCAEGLDFTRVLWSSSDSSKENRLLYGERVPHRVGAKHSAFHQLQVTKDCSISFRQEWRGQRWGLSKLQSAARLQNIPPPRDCYYIRGKRSFHPIPLLLCRCAVYSETNIIKQKASERTPTPAMCWLLWGGYITYCRIFFLFLIQESTMKENEILP